MAAKKGIFLDFTIIIIAFVFMSLFCMWTASYYAGLRIFGDGLFFIKRHVIMLIAGIFIYRFCAKVNVRQLMSVSLGFHLVSLTLLVLVFIPGLGIVVNGARQWLNLGLFRFQPSEWAKLTLLVYLTAEFTRIAMDKWGENKSFYEKRSLFVTAVTVMLVLLEKDFSTALFMLVMFAVLYFIAMPKLTFFWIASAATSLMVVLFLNSGAVYRVHRLQQWVDFIRGKTGPVSQLKFSLLSFSHGGNFGVGFGAGEYKKMLPEAHTDFIFSVIGEEMGFLFVLIIVVLYIIVLIKLMFMMKAAQEPYQFYFTVVAMTLIVGQAIINIGVTLGIFPITGMTLPIISYGRTSLIMFMVLFGLLRSVEKDMLKGG